MECTKTIFAVFTAISCGFMPPALAAAVSAPFDGYEGPRPDEITAELPPPRSAAAVLRDAIFPQNPTSIPTGVRSAMLLGPDAVCVSVGPCLDTNNLAKPGLIRVYSSGDPMYLSGVSASRVFYSPEFISPNGILCYEVFLKVPFKFRSGVKYEVVFNCSNRPPLVFGDSRAWVRTAGKDAYGAGFRVNPCGYPPDAPKRAVLGCRMGNGGNYDFLKAAEIFELRDAFSHKTLFSGKPAACAVPKCAILDFSGFDTRGIFYLSVPGCGRSENFMVSPMFYFKAAEAAAKLAVENKTGGEGLLMFCALNRPAIGNEDGALRLFLEKSVDAFPAAVNRETGLRRAGANAWASVIARNSGEPDFADRLLADGIQLWKKFFDKSSAISGEPYAFFASAALLSATGDDEYEIAAGEKGNPFAQLSESGGLTHGIISVCASYLYASMPSGHGDETLKRELHSWLREASVGTKFRMPVRAFAAAAICGLTGEEKSSVLCKEVFMDMNNSLMGAVPPSDGKAPFGEDRGDGQEDFLSEINTAVLTFGMFLPPAPEEPPVPEDGTEEEGVWQDRRNRRETDR